MYKDKSLFIPKSKFTRQNIHMRLGQVRYYSINRKWVKPTICRSYTSKEVNYKTRERERGEK